MSTIMPLNKIPKPRLPSDFRPIAKLPALAKIIEKIAYLQLYDYIESNNLLSANQFGFRKGKSIDTLLLYLTSLWRQLLDSKPNPIIAIASLDIKKAFDNINHELLKSKLLSKFNLSSKATDWICDYLKNRTMITKIHNTSSYPIVVNRGIPQGSILSPLLFNLFINDLASNNLIENIYLYADDCLIFSTTTSETLLKEKLETDINIALNWYLNNDLSVNTSKTKILILDTSVSNHRSVLFNIGNESIAPSDTLKYLGCIFDTKLKLSTHIKSLCAKTSKRVNLLKILLKYIKPSASLYYKSMIRPILESTPSLLYQISITDSECLEKVQNRALKIISGIYFNKRECTSLSRIRENLNIPLLSSRRLFFYANLLFKSVINTDCILNCLLPPYKQPNSLRSFNHFSPPFCVPKINKSLYGRKSFSYNAAILWNNFPSELRNCKSTSEFNRLSKIFYLDF